MATTKRLRAEYPELVLNVWLPMCDFTKASPIWFFAASPYPGRVQLAVHPAAASAFRCQAAVMLHHAYAFRESAGGTLNCRLITGGKLSSLHAHGIAKDDNPSVNRYRVSKLGGFIQWGKQTDMAPAMVADLEAIRTVRGNKVFAWGGRWWNTKDPMHWEIGCLRSELATGIDLATVKGWRGYLKWGAAAASEEPMIPIDSVQVREIVKRLQGSLNRAAVVNHWADWKPLVLDGKAGPNTSTAADRYRTSAGLEPVSPGVAFDGATIGALLALYP